MVHGTCLDEASRPPGCSACENLGEEAGQEIRSRGWHGVAACWRHAWRRAEPGAGAPEERELPPACLAMAAHPWGGLVQSSQVGKSSGAGQDLWKLRQGCPKGAEPTSARFLRGPQLPLDAGTTNEGPQSCPHSGP